MLVPIVRWHAVHPLSFRFVATARQWDIAARIVKRNIGAWDTRWIADRSRS
jgi:hypothetical protein